MRISIFSPWYPSNCFLPSNIIGSTERSHKEPKEIARGGKRGKSYNHLEYAARHSLLRFINKSGGRGRDNLFRIQRLITSVTLTTAFMEPLNSTVKIIRTLKATLFNVAFSLAPPPRLTLFIFSFPLFLSLSLSLSLSLALIFFGRYLVQPFTGKSQLDYYSIIKCGFALSRFLYTSWLN